MQKDDVMVRIGGQAGDGSYAAGELLAKVLKHSGLWVVTLRDFPSRIRGGHTNYTVRAKDRPIYGRGDYIDFLVAFDQDSILLHSGEMRPGGAIIYDSSLGITVGPELHRDDVSYFPIPLGQLAKEKLGALIVRNSIALGALVELLGMSDDPFLWIIDETFAKKGLAGKNRDAYLLGREEARRARGSFSGYSIEPDCDEGRIFLLGDEAIAYGALVAGCRLEVAYPITPATEIIEWLAPRLPQYGGAVLQAEDEIAAICMAIGASYAGVRAMTTTSGPGFALMTEALAMVGENETPVVIVDAQRAGPSTGLPTKTEQGDLNQAIFSAHGDFPRIVISPGNVEESFYLIAEAFNLADRFQCPVILLTEQTVAQTKQTIPRFDLSRITIDRGKLLSQEELAKLDGYRRYALTEDGISPRARPGLAGGNFIANSNEHNEASFIDESVPNRILMMNKRMRKLEVAKAYVPPPQLHGDEEGEIGFIGYGGVYGPVLEAMDALAQKGLRSKFLQLVTLWPFPEGEVQAFLEGVRKAFVVEQNYTGQLRGLIQRFVGPSPKIESVLRYDGQPFRPLDIVEAVEAKTGVIA